VLATSVRPLAVLEAEEALEPFGGLEGIRPMDRTSSAARAKAQCQPFPSCPMTGMRGRRSTQTDQHPQRTFPKSTVTKVLTFDELDLLQALTDSKGIPQGEHLWTPAAFRALQKQGRKVLIRGGLFYDSAHIVNTDENSTISQPKRFTLWEIHPITAVLVCEREDNACDPTVSDDWTPLK